MIQRIWTIIRLKFEKFGSNSKEGDKERRIVESQKRDEEGVTLEHRFERNSERTATAMSMVPRRAASRGGGKVAVPDPVPVAQLVPLPSWRRCAAGASRGAVGRAESGRREATAVPVLPSRVALAAFLAGVQVPRW
jgi:hypothetical protein